MIVDNNPLLQRTNLQCEKKSLAVATGAALLSVPNFVLTVLTDVHRFSQAHRNHLKLVRKMLGFQEKKV
jgi:hypothetical protein